jgi:integrase
MAAISGTISQPTRCSRGFQKGWCFLRFTRQRYQSGSLSKEVRKSSPAVWIFRWREETSAGRVNRKQIVGTVEQFPTKRDAKRAVEHLRLHVNAENPAVPVTIRQVVKHYELNELPNKAFSTQRTFNTSLNTWILPKWGEHMLTDVKTVQVESWLRSLSLANHTKAKLRNTMHLLFSHACRHDWLGKNPMSLVRQSAKREKLPDVLETTEVQKLLGELQNPARSMVFLAAATGLRISELLGLKWSDIDYDAAEIRLSRAVVHQHVGEMKTEASQKPVPMDGALLETLKAWHQQTPYRKANDWVFASPETEGRNPYWPETHLKYHVQPAAKRLGITKQIGWHSFRRTFATLLKASGEDVKTTQELMRHANSRLTLDVYAQALNPAKRAAHLKLVDSIKPAPDLLVVPTCSHGNEAEAVSS